MSEPPPRPRLSRRKRLAFALVPLALLLLAGELAVRLRRGALFDLSDPRAARIRIFRSAYPAVPDPRLGYVPRPGAAGIAAQWQTQVTIDAAGLRANGTAAPPPGPPVLAVGDSFTFGDEVSDAETWPARLEARLKRRVLNGGVFGYGLDQVVLRAEALLEQTSPAPAALVVSFVPDDVRRCAFAFRFAPKPYFALVDGALELRNVPVPAAGARLRCYSHLVDALMVRLANRWWHASHTERAHHDEVAVARLLVARLAARAKARDLPLLLVTQGWPTAAEAPLIEPVIAEARRLKVPLLDLWSEQRSLDEATLAPRYTGEAGSHMSAAGNAWVAARIEQELRRRWPRLGR